ncbi:hypothetical protein TEA_022179 [Camellia sinensis var. sinensis]|uniref:Uncharacterized protein n=1 Tax=Camellia sinensis var. sinensis TaxID=542762 RepID=A0A4S4F366_CAMSN|nr:hypothetical protein TEA_022179 [Camellia sinensis var. sinensis]
MDEMDAVLQLIRLTRDRKLKNEEEQSTGDSTADLSFSSMIRKIRDKKLGSIGMDIHRIMKPLIDKHGKNQERAWHRMLSDNLYLYASSSPKKTERLSRCRSRRTMNAGDMTQPDMEAAHQLLQLCDNSNRYTYKDVKAKEEEEESNSDTSYITDDSSPAMETNLAAQQIMQLSRNSDSKDTEEREEEAKGGGEEESKSNTSSVIKGGVFMKGCEAFCPRKRKFRSIVDIYRTTKPFD